MGLAHSPRIVTDGLVFFVDAANTKSYSGSGSTWYDLTRNGYNVTLYNTPAYSSGTFQFRSALSTYSTTSFDQGVLKQTNELGTWSIETYFKQVSAANTSEAIVAGRSGCHGGIYAYNDNTLRHAIKTTESNCWTGAMNTTVVTMSAESWYHSIMSYENGYTKHYVNGELIGSTTFDRNTYTMAAYGDTFYIGGISGRHPNIDLRMVRCYTTALTDEQAKINYSAIGGWSGN
jgi:hypothetical protein